jgi:GNAT superfamily N-acetyltransferase
MIDLQIRTAGPADAPALGALVQRAIRASNSADYAPAIIELMCANFEPGKVLERMAARDVFAAIHDGGIIGTVSFSLPRCKLYSLFIEPRVQRSGTGQRLVGYIERHAVRLGCVSLQLSASITARPFYERLGYETITFEERVNDGSTWLMRKALPGGTPDPHLANAVRPL